MGECRLNHSTEDVLGKLAEQTPYLPAQLGEQLRSMLEKPQSQERLNELFHLLKKYDLASAEERSAREAKMAELVEAAG